jgi:hypothetical protein
MEPQQFFRDAQRWRIFSLPAHVPPKPLHLGLQG